MANCLRLCGDDNIELLQINIFIQIYNLQFSDACSKATYAYAAISRRKILRGFEKVEHCSSDHIKFIVAKDVKNHTYFSLHLLTSRISIIAI